MRKTGRIALGQLMQSRARRVLVISVFIGSGLACMLLLGSASHARDVHLDQGAWVPDGTDGSIRISEEHAIANIWLGMRTDCALVAMVCVLSLFYLAALVSASTSNRASVSIHEERCDVEE